MICRLPFTILSSFLEMYGHGMLLFLGEVTTYNAVFAIFSLACRPSVSFARCSVHKANCSLFFN